MRPAEVRRIAMSLPEVAEAPHFHYTSFRVRGRIFLTLAPGGDHIHVFVGDEERQRALALAPEVLEKLLWGGKVVGLRVSLAKAGPSMVRHLVQRAWSLKAPASLVRACAPPHG